MNCWFTESVTDSFELSRLAPLHDGLGFVPGSCCPHYDGEDQRRPVPEFRANHGSRAVGKPPAICRLRVGAS
jgi:hypothetical protein